MDESRSGSDERVLDAGKECGIWIETGKGNGHGLEPFGTKVRVDELINCAFGRTGSIDCGKVREDLARRFGGRFVDESLRVLIQLSKIDGLEELLPAR